MKIKFDEKLKAYMASKGCKDLVLYVREGNTCCGGSFLDVKARLFKHGDETLIHDGYVAMESEIGKVYYHPEEIIMESSAKIICNRLLGLTVIQPMGFRAVDDRWGMLASV